MQTRTAELNPVRQKKKEGLLSCLGEAALYAAAFLVTLLLFMTVKPYYDYNGTRGVVAQSLTAVLAGGAVVAGAYLKMAKKLDTRRLVLLFLFAGFVLRVGYMLCTPASYRQHDMYFGGTQGHEGYAWGIFTTGKLPDSNVNQLYHPPLNALVQAGFMHFMSGLENSLSSLLKLGGYFTDGFLFGKPSSMDAGRYALYSSCQILSVMYSFVVCVISLKLLRLFGIGGKPFAFLAAFMIFYPRGIHFAAALNNDPVAYMFSMFALYFAVKWWKKDKSFLNILLCALGVGLGMMGKMASATICLPIAGIFIYEFVRTLKKREGALCLGRMIGQYAAFLAVCAPLGLWFQIYAYIRFDQPFGYVFSNLRGDLSTADRTFFQRFFPIAFDLREYFASLWCHTISNESLPNNYNLFHFALRSSIFGEQSYSRGDSFAAAAVIFAYIAVVALAASLVRALYLFFRYDRKREREESAEMKRNVFFAFLLVASQVVSEIYFYVQMPYACTMDFRYIMPLILGMGLTLWLTLGRLRRDGGGFSLVLYRLTIVSAGAFLLFSVLFYMICI